MTDQPIVDQFDGTTFDVACYVYSPPDDPEMLDIRDDGMPCMPDDAPAVLLRAEEGSRGRPQYWHLDPDAARALAHELVESADWLEAVLASR